jgi:hypothetical protein
MGLSLSGKPDSLPLPWKASITKSDGSNDRHMDIEIWNILNSKSMIYQKPKPLKIYEKKQIFVKRRKSECSCHFNNPHFCLT